jgi:putative ABC transport system ATP-binding protein
MTPPLLEAEDVGKSYRDRSILSGINLQIDAAERVVLIGRSGSGKSTLLNLMAGLDQPSSGRIVLDGQVLAGGDERRLALLRRRAMGFVFQFFNLIPTLTAGENVRFPLQLNGVPERIARRRAEQLLDDFGLGALSHRLPEELSGGEQQRIAIARAIIHRPRIVFADEPTGNLDLDTARQVVALLDQVCRRDGCALLMATHAPEVVGLADRVLTIRDGRLEDASL